MARTDNVSRLEEQEMQICTTCTSYLNLYCSQEELPSVGAYSYTNKELCLWRCSICGAGNVAPSYLFNHSEATASPIVEYRQRGTWSGSSNSTHEEFIAESSPRHCTMILLDASLPPQEVMAILSSFEKLWRGNDSNSGSKFGLLIFGHMVHIYQIGLRGIASADVYNPLQHPEDCVVDDGYDNTREYFGDWNEVEYCASIYFGITQNMQRKDKDDEKPEPSLEEQSSKPLSRKEMLKHKKEARLKEKQRKVNRKFDGFDPEQTAALIMTKRNRSGIDRQKNKTQRKAVRCTGDATSYALHLLESMDCNTGRILIFTNGCCNFGNGSVVSDTSMREENATEKNLSSKRVGDILDPEQMVHASKYFQSLGLEAFEEGVGIDVFCSGNGELGTQALFSLVKPTSGYVLNHTSFHEDQSSLQRDLAFIYNDTSMSRANTGVNSLDGVVFDIRTPEFVTPQLIHGMGAIILDEEVLDLSPNEKSVFTECYTLASSQSISTHEMPSDEVLESTLTRIQIGRFDPNTSISVIFYLDESNKVNRSDQQTYTHFQFITRFIDPRNGIDLVTRVCTQRVPISTDENSYLQSLNDEVIPAVIAKQAAYRSMVSREEEYDEYFNLAVDHEDVEQYALEARRDLDATLYEISKAYRSERVKGNNEEESKDIFHYALPQELSKPMKQLYHFRRGSILRSGIQCVGDRFLQRSIFLRMPLKESLQMMSPLLWRYQLGADGRIGLEPIPAETLALWDEHVLAADCYDTLIIWSGKNTLHESYDCLRKACSEFLIQRSRYRFPAPSLYELKEGESMCRKLLHRLIPSHGDPFERQLENFPALNSLSLESLGVLRAKFRFYDAEIDPSFWKWFRVTVKEDKGGRTLCD